jgi:hypothetical protein
VKNPELAQELKRKAETPTDDAPVLMDVPEIDIT